MIDGHLNIEVQIQITLHVHPNSRRFAIFPAEYISIKKYPSGKINPFSLLLFRRP
jgi:hypothetical protein